MVFCSASFKIEQKYNDAAKEVVAALVGAGYGIVSGGTIKGTMDVVAREAAALGAENIGIIPKFMAQYVSPVLTQTIWTETMSQRKDKMRELGCDLTVAIPGGIGTLDEFFETFTLAKLGLYSGKIIVYNVFGFYEKLRELLDFYVEVGMLDSKTRAMVSFPSTIEELLAEI